MNNNFIYYLDISIRNTHVISIERYGNKYNDISSAIKSGKDYIREYISDYYNDDQDDIDYYYNQNNNIEFSKEFELYFEILCINERKPIFDTDKEVFKIIYDNYKESNNLFDSLLNVIDCRIILDINGIIEDCFWDNDNIHYVPIIGKNINEYKYPIGTIVELHNGVYKITQHSEFSPETILTGHIDNINTYGMDGIRNGSYDHIRLDDNINESQFTTDISDNNKYLIPFVENIEKIIDHSIIDNNTIDDYAITKKYLYWIATNEIKYDL